MSTDEAPKSKKSTILVAIVAAILVVAALGIYLIVSKLGDVAKAEQYEISGDSVPSMAKVVGYRKIRGYSTKIATGLSSKELTYVTDDAQKDVAAYVRYLRGNDNFILLTDFNPGLPTGNVQLAKPSTEQGKLVLVEIDYRLGGYTVKLVKGKGELHLNNSGALAEET